METKIPTKETFREFYNHAAPWDISRPQEPFVKAAAEISGSVLDTGCGTGDNALFFAQQGCQVTGVDFLEEPIQRAKKKASQRGINATFLVQDALQLSKLNQQFDNIIDSGLFHVFSDEDRMRYVAELAKVLKPNGRFFMMCFSDAEPGTDGPRRVFRQELQTTFADGWQIESIDAVRFGVAENLSPQMQFTPGGPHAWFCKIRRTK
ncbi:MAG TPA: class I SAM-dependent methyltransferase [Pirellulales bacterium]|jgi:cyclopropane fatty-acyl-phospholipid synthase-like methyltransferase|nr:class I SAM-dependent methyltransferase [Pirellulales bacterium]